MNNICIKHFETREYVYPIERNTLVLKLECNSQQNCEINLVYWKRFHENQSNTKKFRNFNYEGTSKYFDLVLKLDEVARYLNYYFQIFVSDEVFYFSPNGVSKEKPSRYFAYQSTNELDVMHYPSWARGIVGYHVFLDRFFNGDKNNDPQVVEEWNSIPTRTNFFGGDIRGLILKIKYLTDLGIKFICLTPIFLASSNHKYDTIDYFSIDPIFGSKEELIELVKLCHENDIRIVLDGVFNHIGFYSNQFQDVIAKGKNSQYWDWFYIQGDKIDVNNINYECVGDYKWMPKLRYSSNALREFILSIGEYWIKETGIDGWRLDVADEVDFTFWPEFRKAVKKLDPNTLLIAETWRDGRDLLRGDQMDTVMNYQFRDSVIDYFIKNSIDSAMFKQRIEDIMYHYPLPVHNILYNLLGSHDTDRIMSVSDGNEKSMKLAIAFLLTFPGMPVVYYGDEIGLNGENDPSCRNTMKWDSIDYKIHHFYQSMIHFRNSHHSLRYGDFTHLNVDSKLYCFTRSEEEEIIIVIFNIQSHDYSTAFKYEYVVNEIKKVVEIKSTIKSKEFMVFCITKDTADIKIERFN